MGPRVGPGLTAAVLDSNILIDALNGHRVAFDAIDAQEECLVSRVSWIEVLAGCRTQEEDAVARRLLSSLTLVEISADIAELAVTLRRERRLKLPDAVIFATARLLDVPLLSRNTKDFPATDPSVRVPYEL